MEYIDGINQIEVVLEKFTPTERASFESKLKENFYSIAQEIFEDLMVSFIFELYSRIYPALQSLKKVIFSQKS